MLALVVEDEPGLRIIYRRVLEGIDFKVLEASDGVEALAILAKHSPNIVFLDMLLPNLNGIPVLEHLKTDPRHAHTHTIMVSSNQQFARFAEPERNVAFYLKPIRPSTIRELAEQALGSRQI